MQSLWQIVFIMISVLSPKEFLILFNTGKFLLMDSSKTILSTPSFLKANALFGLFIWHIVEVFISKSYSDDLIISINEGNVTVSARTPILYNSFKNLFISNIPSFVSSLFPIKEA